MSHIICSIPEQRCSGGVESPPNLQVFGGFSCGRPHPPKKNVGYRWKFIKIDSSQEGNKQNKNDTKSSIVKIVATICRRACMDFLRQ